MAKITPGAIISEISGSIAQVTYSRSKYGAYSKAKLNQTNPDTPAQQAARALTSAAVAAWQSLGQALQNEWSTFAVSQLSKPRLSLRSTLNGYNAFIRFYIMRNTYGLTGNPTPLGEQPIGNYSNFIFTATDSILSLSLDGDNTNSDIMAVACLSGPRSPGQSTITQTLIVNMDFAQAPNGTLAFDLLSDWEAKWGSLASHADQKIFCRIDIVNRLTAQKVPVFRGAAIIDAINPLLDNAALILNFSLLSSMLQEGPVPLTPVTADAQTVGLVYDQSANGMILKNPTAGTIPTLGSDATKKSFLIFNGTNNRLIIANSRGFFKRLHAVIPVFAFAFWLKMNGGDSSFQRIFNNNGAGAGIGIDFIRWNDNKLICRSSYAAASYNWSVTSTANVNVALGWIGVVVSLNGQGATAGRFMLIQPNGTVLEDKTFNVGANGVDADSQDNMFIGSRASLLQFFNGSLGPVIVRPDAVTQTIIDAFIAYNPDRASNPFTPILHTLYDFNDSAYLFSDAGGTTPVINNDPIRVAANKKAENFGPLYRNLIGGAGTSPIWLENQWNGNSIAEWNGPGINFDFQDSFLEEVGGLYTLFIVVQNKPASFGSHIFSGNNVSTVGAYIVLTTKDYNVPSVNTSRFVTHPNPSGGCSNSIPSVDPAADIRSLLAFMRNGQNLSSWNAAKANQDDVCVNKMEFRVMGLDDFIGSNWDFRGYAGYVLKYNGLVPNAERDAIINSLVTRFALQT